MEAAILAAVDDDMPVSCLIPGWEPVDLAMGLQWAKASIYEAFYVKFKVEKTANEQIVRFAIWEYGEDEPSR
jgi:hypothetical protein